MYLGETPGMKASAQNASRRRLGLKPPVSYGSPSPIHSQLHLFTLFQPYFFLSYLALQCLLNGPHVTLMLCTSHFKSCTFQLSLWLDVLSKSTDSVFALTNNIISPFKVRILMLLFCWFVFFKYVFFLFFRYLFFLTSSYLVKIAVFALINV